MNDRFLFNAVVSSYYDIDTPEHYEEFEPKIYLENVDLFSDEIGIDYDRLLESVQNQLKLEKPEISQIMQYFEDNSISNSEEYVTIKPDKVLQSTGLKDKNGKLIYEGDIVRYTEYEIEDIDAKELWHAVFNKMTKPAKRQMLNELLNNILGSGYMTKGCIFGSDDTEENKCI